MKVNGWTLYWHPAFSEKFKGLVSIVQGIQANRPEDIATSDHVKLLTKIVAIISAEIPQGPNHANYVQGNTLGKPYRNWRRAKFFERFRLFFRFSTKQKIIIYAWVNDKNTLRQAGGKTDPYKVFAKKLAQGDPPDDWEALLKSCNEIAELATVPEGEPKNTGG